jgi:erythromycin esterase-like protein
MARTALREAEGAAASTALRSTLRPLGKTPEDYSPLIDAIGNARFALIGEASHGTHDFYRERAEITKRLIVEKGYTAIAVEADWPDAYRVNRYVRGLSNDRNARQALSGFKRFPTWMWRNTVVADFVEWLREFNKGRPAAGKAGFYGIDLYSLFKSIEAVLQFLDRVDPEAARRARYRYGCFDHYGEDSQAYGYAAAFGMKGTCEDDVVAQLAELTRNAVRLPQDSEDADELFFARQNARLVKNAEKYYRTMFRGRVSSWNLRDEHMVETISELDAHLGRHGDLQRIAVWAHNSHLGDASATEMGDAGEWNVGQLMRKHYGSQAFLLGFSTYQGTVTAASDWDGEIERKRVRPGLAGSYEKLFHESGTDRFMLLLRGNPELRTALAGPLLQRAIGVIYLPESERTSHYFHARLPSQFDAMIHLDETRALEPLDATSPASAEVPETFPSGV